MAAELTFSPYLGSCCQSGQELQPTTDPGPSFGKSLEVSDLQSPWEAEVSA